MTWLTWLPRIVLALLWYAGELVKANVAVISDVITPGQRSDPIIVGYRTRCRTELEVALLAVLITLTPGTLTMSTTFREDDRSADGDSDGDGRAYDIYVHAMFPGTAAGARGDIEVMETKMLSALRRHGAPPPVQDPRSSIVTGTGATP